MVPPTPRDPFDRLLDRCEWVGDCLIWQGGGPRGYGLFRATTRQADAKAYVHRWIYENTIGPVPDGWDVDHVALRGCTSKRCVNPEHLEAVTHRENQRRMRLEVCRSGRHDLTDPANQQWDTQGNRRGCFACRKLAQNRRRKGN